MKNLLTFVFVSAVLVALSCADEFDSKSVEHVVGVQERPVGVVPVKDSEEFVENTETRRVHDCYRRYEYCIGNCDNFSRHCRHQCEREHRYCLEQSEQLYPLGGGAGEHVVV